VHETFRHAASVKNAPQRAIAHAPALLSFLLQRLARGRSGLALNLRHAVPRRHGSPAFQHVPASGRRDFPYDC